VLLVRALTGRYHLDETRIQSSAEKLDWSRSWDYPDQSLFSLISEKLFFTLMLQCVSFLFVLVGSFFLSLTALYWRFLFSPIEGILALGISAPSLFWIPLLIYFFSLKMTFFPLRFEPTFRGWILPLLALTLRSLCLSTEILLSEWKKSESQPYFVVARSKGLSRIQVFYRHGLRNAMIPYSTQLGSFFVHSLMGSVLIENLFSFPGMGLLFVESLQNRDLPVILTLTLLFTVLMMIIHGSVEALHSRLEPRAAQRVRA
jgi:oligopeptide transport system permease protein